MNLFSQINNLSSLESLYVIIFDKTSYICNILFNYCPLHNQFLYFYFPIFYFLLTKNYSNNTAINYVFIKILIIFKKSINLNTFLFYFTIFFKKLMFFFKIKLSQIFGIYLSFFYSFFKKNLLWITWKPIFKKLSYFGVFSFIRTKWFKNK